jgi:hypothetical protein
VVVEITVSADNVVVYRKCVEGAIGSKIDVISIIDIISIVDPVCGGEYTSLFLGDDDTEACSK